MSGAKNADNQWTRDTSKFIDDSSDEYYALWWLLLQARRSAYTLREKEVNRYGLTPENVAVLFAIQAIGPEATPAEISRWILRKPNSTSGLLNRMERNGLITKSKDLRKKHMVRVVITEKGRLAYEKSARRESIRYLFGGLSEEERQQGKAFLLKLRDRATEELGTTSKPIYPLL